MLSSSRFFAAVRAAQTDDEMRVLIAKAGEAKDYPGCRRRRGVRQDGRHGRGKRARALPPAHAHEDPHRRGGAREGGAPLRLRSGLQFHRGRERENIQKERGDGDGGSLDAEGSLRAGVDDLLGRANEDPRPAPPRGGGRGRGADVQEGFRDRVPRRGGGRRGAGGDGAGERAEERRCGAGRETVGDDSRYIPPMRGHFYDVVYFQDTYPFKEKRYDLHMPKDKPVQYEVYNGTLYSAQRFDEKETHYSWWLFDIPAIEEEPRMAEAPDVATKLVLATLPSWEEKSRWFAAIHDTIYHGQRADQEAGEGSDRRAQDRRREGRRPPALGGAGDPLLGALDGKGGGLHAPSREDVVPGPLRRLQGQGGDARHPHENRGVRRLAGAHDGRRARRGGARGPVQSLRRRLAAQGRHLHDARSDVGALLDRALELGGAGAALRDRDARGGRAHADSVQSAREARAQGRLARRRRQATETSRERSISKRRTTWISGCAAGSARTSATTCAPTSRDGSPRSRPTSR